MRAKAALLDKKYDRAVALLTQNITSSEAKATRNPAAFFVDHRLFSLRSAAYYSRACSNHDQPLRADLEAALRDADRCVELQPAWWEGYYRRGVALSRLSRFNESLAAFDRSIRLGPPDPAVIQNVRAATIAVRQREEAKAPERAAAAAAAAAAKARPTSPVVVAAAAAVSAYSLTNVPLSPLKMITPPPPPSGGTHASIPGGGGARSAFTDTSPLSALVARPAIVERLTADLAAARDGLGECVASLAVQRTQSATREAKLRRELERKVDQLVVSEHLATQLEGAHDDAAASRRHIDALERGHAAALAQAQARGAEFERAAAKATAQLSAVVDKYHALEARTNALSEHRSALVSRLDDAQQRQRAAESALEEKARLVREKVHALEMAKAGEEALLRKLGTAQRCSADADANADANVDAPPRTMPIPERTSRVLQAKTHAVELGLAREANLRGELAQARRQCNEHASRLAEHVLCAAGVGAAATARLAAHAAAAAATRAAQPIALLLTPTVVSRSQSATTLRLGWAKGGRPDPATPTRSPAMRKSLLASPSVYSKSPRAVGDGTSSCCSGKSPRTPGVSSTRRRERRIGAVWSWSRTLAASSSFDFLVQLPASESKGATSLGHAFRVKYVLTSSDGGDIDFGLATATIRSPAVESVLAASSKYVAAAPLSVAAAPRKGSDDPNFQRRCLAKAGYSTIEWQLLHEVAPVAPALLRSEKDTAGGRVDGTVVLPATTRLLLMRFKSQQRVRWLSWGVPSRKISMRLAVEPIS